MSSTRLAIADEAARILDHHGTRDYAQARRRAGRRFGVEDERQLPRDDEIEQALRTRQQLFAGASQPQALRARRAAAVEAMEFFSAFEPRLVGDVVDGTADVHSAVILHVFEDDELRVVELLRANGIDFELGTRRVRYAAGLDREVPVFRFDAGEVPFDLLLFPQNGLHEAPLDRVLQRPLKRVSRANLLWSLEREKQE